MPRPRKREPFTLAADRSAWHKQPGESSELHQLFDVYKALGPGRTVDKAAELTGRKRGTIGHYCVVYSWTARAEAWDQEVRSSNAARAQAAVEAAQLETIERSRALAGAHYKRAVDGFDEIQPVEHARLALAHDKNVREAAGFGRPQQLQLTGSGPGGAIQVQDIEARHAAFVERLLPVLQQVLAPEQWDTVKALMLGDSPAELSA